MVTAYKFILTLVATFLSVHVCAENEDLHCPRPPYAQSLTWKNKMRLKALKKLDQFLSWSTTEKMKTFVLVEPPDEETFEVDIKPMQNFATQYSYFSSHPIVGTVSTNEEDLNIVCCVLQSLFDQGDDLEYLKLATAELLCKALAYRDLKEGQKISIPIVYEGKVRFNRFIVDHLFNLWRGMPAFGLVSQEPEIEPILLFRGTDFSLDSQRGWASLMSDLDLAGPGLTAFQNAKEEIHQWLMQIAEKGKPARVMGFSLGGALAAYTFIYENAWVAQAGSFAFCPPGVSEKVIEEWKQIKNKQGFTIYVNEGDIISKIGRLFGAVYVLSMKKPLKPLSAHTALMSGSPIFFKSRVDTQQDNQERYSDLKQY